MKYTIEIKFKNGQISSHQATEIHFHSRYGGIDIYNGELAIPFFPGREEEVEQITIILNDNIK